MLFSPRNEKMWDTWLVEREGLYHLFYIRIGPNAGRVGPKPMLGAGWDGISLATSTDLLHWQEQGPVIEKHDEAAWLGTGMIHRVADKYILNFSEERPRGQQVVVFAESDDLRTWTRLPESSDLRPDDVIYQRDPAKSADPLPRWDSLGIIPPDGSRSEFLAIICANSTQTLPGSCGTLGLLESADGREWTLLPPVVEPGLFPSYEVPEHVRFGDRHYVLFSTNSSAGPRFDERTVHPHSGTYYVVADDVRGPYRRPPGDPLLHGHRMLGPMLGTYVGRPFRQPSGELLMYHQWTANFPTASWGPPKRLVEVGEFELGLEYWPGCEGLRGELLVQPDALNFRRLPLAGQVPVIDFSPSPDGVAFVNRGGTAGVEIDLSTPGDTSMLSDGRFVEAALRIESGRSAGLSIGWEGSTDRTAVSLNAQNSSVEIGTARYHKDSASDTFDVVEVVPWKVTTKQDYAVRLLFRKSFVDVYLDDRLVTSFVNAAPFDPARLGVYAELATGSVRNLHVWSMK